MIVLEDNNAYTAVKAVAASQTAIETNCNVMLMEEQQIQMIHLMMMYHIITINKTLQCSIIHNEISYETKFLCLQIMRAKHTTNTKLKPS